MDHVCSESRRLEKIEASIDKVNNRLGEGDVSFNSIQNTLDQILAQTQKTNGRVTKAETDIVDIKTESLKNKYTWKMVVKDISVSIVSVGGIVFALTRILGG